MRHSRKKKAIIFVILCLVFLFVDKKTVVAADNMENKDLSISNNIVAKVEENNVICNSEEDIYKAIENGIKNHYSKIAIKYTKSTPEQSNKLSMDIFNIASKVLRYNQEFSYVSLGSVCNTEEPNKKLLEINYLYNVENKYIASLEGVKFICSKKVLIVGEEGKFDVIPKNGQFNKELASFYVFKNKDGKRIIEVNDYGKFKAVEPGVTDVKMKYNGMYCHVFITVLPKDVKYINNNKDFLDTVKYMLNNKLTKMQVYFNDKNYGVEKSGKGINENLDTFGAGYVYGFRNEPLGSYIEISYYDKDKFDTDRKKLLDKVKEVINNTMKPNMTDIEKEVAIHDYVVNHTQYDRNYHSSIGAQGTYKLLFEGKGICGDYAITMCDLLNLVGVETRTIDGTAGEKDEAHGWNLVKIDGEWYHLDATWDDPISPDGTQVLSHEYFNKSDEQMAKDHKWDRQYYPKCNSNKYLKLQNQ